MLRTIKNILLYVRQIPGRIYNHYSFSSSIWGIFFNPFYFARKELFLFVKKAGSQLNGKVLDVGCGTKPYKKLISYECYVGLEYDTEENRKNKNADFFYDGHQFPFENASFDSILCNQVLEHVFNPDKFLSEVSRVLRPGGKLLLTVPFVWDEHEQPFDYGRYTSFGLKELLFNHGFTVLEHHKTCNDFSAISQLYATFIFKKIMNRNVLIRIPIFYLLIVPGNLFGLILKWILPKNNDLYLDNVILAEKQLNDAGEGNG
ncbi:MAG: class I SAM-dependent methyltransferase [Lentisphaeria bacterium]|nr:class I SAM-dependent methyltransferase [Lentisphaeria bacterium]